MIVAKPQTPPARRWLAHLVRAAESTAGPAAREAALPPFDADAVLALARREALAPSIHVAVVGGRIGVELPEPFRNACEADYYATLHRNVVGLKAGRRALDALRRGGIDAAPLGAWSLLDGAMPFRPDVGSRPLDGLELMVRESQRRAAASALEELGFRRSAARAGEPCLELSCDGSASVPPLRLHWRWDAGRSAAVAAGVSGDRFLDDLCDTTVWGRPWATRFAVLASAALGAARRVPGNWIELADIHRIVTALPMDWDAAVAAARRWRVTAPVYAGLVATRVLFGTEIPDAALDGLAPGPVRRHLLHRSLATARRPHSAPRPAHLWMAENWWELARAAARAAASRSAWKPLP